MKVLSVDPSIKNVGWAVWKQKKPVDYGLIKTNPKDYLSKRLAEIQKRITEIIIKHNVDTLVIEEPPTYTRQGRNVESIIKLSAGYGCIISAFKAYVNGNGQVYSVHPETWKGGKTSKKVTLNLVKYYYGISGVRHDVIDAIGIGHWYISKINIQRRIKCQ